MGKESGHHSLSLVAVTIAKIVSIQKLGTLPMGKSLQMKP
jgi:hypothetical protein